MKGGQLHLKEQNVFVANGCLDSNDWFQSEMMMLIGARIHYSDPEKQEIVFYMTDKKSWAIETALLSGALFVVASSEG